MKRHVLKQEFDICAPAGPFETLREHRWKIVLCAAMGLLAAAGPPNALHRSLESRWSADVGFHLVFDIVAQVTLQFADDVRRVQSCSGRFPASCRELSFQIKHVRPSVAG